MQGLREAPSPADQGSNPELERFDSVDASPFQIDLGIDANGQIMQFSDFQRQRSAVLQWCNDNLPAGSWRYGYQALLLDREQDYILYTLSF
jgi:hypothetical protein